MFLRSSLLLITALTSMVLGCSGTAVGTDGDGTSTPGSETDSNGPAPSAPAAPGPVDFEALFGAPATATITDNVVTGLWGGSAGPNDVRLKLGTSSIVVAVKCSSTSAVGAEVAANVSTSAIRILSSKEVRGNPYCYFDVRPRTILRCESTMTSADECFEITGTTLRLRNVRLFTLGGGYTHDDTLSKLSD